MKYKFLFLIVILFASCTRESVVERELDFTAANEEEILAYIADNNLTAEKSASGLYYVTNELGSGEQPELSSNVTVAYKGYFTDGFVFDETNAAGVSFDLSTLIAGFAEGITYFKEGGDGVLLIPSRLGYGNDGNGTIPGGSVIVFDVTLVSVN